MKVAVIKHLLVTAMLAVLAGCEMTVSDPFAGQDGIRVNMNGCKCVTWSESSKLSAQYTLASDYRFSSSTGLIRVIDETLFRLNLTVLDSQPLQTGKKYLFDGLSCEL